MGDPIKDRYPIIDSRSSVWQIIVGRFHEIAKKIPNLQNRFNTAHTGFDLGSGSGQSTVALRKLCPKLTTIHCADNLQQLEEPFKSALGPGVVEHRDTMEQFVASMAEKGQQADIVMIAAMRGQPFLNPNNLRNLALSIKKGGVLLSYNADFPISDNQSRMTDYFFTFA